MNIKKYLCYGMAVCSVMSFTACSNQDNKKEEQKQNNVTTQTQTQNNTENTNKIDNKTVDKEVIDSIVEQIKTQVNENTNKNTKVTIENNTKHLFFMEGLTFNIKDKDDNNCEVYVSTPAEVLEPGQKTYINILSKDSYKGITDLTYNLDNVYSEYYNKSSDYTKIELDSLDITYNGDYFVGAIKNNTDNKYNNVSIFVDCEDEDGFVHSYIWINELTEVLPKEKYEMELLILSIKDEVLNKINAKTKFNIKFFAENAANENLFIK